MTTQRPTPLRIGGRVTPRRVNELVEARLLDITGDGVITVKRIGERAVIGLNLHKLWASLPKPPRAMRGVIKSASASTGLPSTITYTIGFHATTGDPALSFTNKTPWYRPVDTIEVVAAQVGSDCLVMSTRDENDKPDLDLVLCSELLVTEECDPARALSVLPTHIDDLLFDAYGKHLLTADGSLIIAEVDQMEADEVTAIESILTDDYGRPLRTNAGTLLMGEADVSEQYGAAIQQVACDAYGRTMQGNDGRVILLNS